MIHRVAVLQFMKSGPVVGYSGAGLAIFRLPLQIPLHLPLPCSVPWTRLVDVSRSFALGHPLGFSSGGTTRRLEGGGIMKSGYFPDSFLPGHCGVVQASAEGHSARPLPATPLFSVVTHPPSGLVGHIRLISLNPVHTLLNNSLVKLSLRIHFEYSICFLAT